MNMPKKLYTSSIPSKSLEILDNLYSEASFDPFRLVGCTSLSLQLGHRKSVDIDMFTDAVYTTIDFRGIDDFLNSNYEYVDTIDSIAMGMGKSYYIGESEKKCVKVDLFYTKPFIRPVQTIEKMRLATLEDIVAMKIDVISREGHKKDFWDIHELFGHFSLGQMIELHKEMFPYSHNRQDILGSMVNFESARNDLDPVCLKGKHWERIMLDILDTVRKFR